MLGEGASPGSDLPETVQALIAARLDTLAAELKSLLHDASVLGKVFWTGALATMGDRPRDDVLAGLRELVRREFVRPARLSSMRDEEEFSFWHVLVRDVAYQQIPRATRGRKHVQAAEWIEHTAEGRLGDHAEFLAHHYSQALELARASGAGDPAGLEERFVRFSVLAGDRAMNLDVGAAEASYRRAIAAVVEPRARAAVLAKLAEALSELGKLVDAEAAYEEAVGLLGQPGDEREEAFAKLGLSRALWRHGQTARARTLTYEVVEALEDGGGPDLVLAYSRAAAADVLGGRAREGLAWAEKGFALAHDLGIQDSAPMVRLLQMRGIARIDLGDRSGLEDMHAALELSLELGLGIDTGTSYLNYAESLSRFEPIAASGELLEASIEFARRRGLTHHEMWSRMAMLWHLYESGRWDELLSEAGELSRWDAEQGGTQIEVGTNLAAAPVLVHRGALDEAERRVRLFLPRAREIEDAQTLQPALVVAALVRFANGDRDEALSLIGEFEQLTKGRPNRRVEDLAQTVHIAVASGALELGERLLAGSVEARQTLPARSTLTVARALVSEARGESEAAGDLYREAAAGWEEWGSVIGRAYALLGLGRCGGDRAATDEAMAIFDRLGAVPLTTTARAA
jgi:tetratricopeptide (TPR) repeat protein